MLRRNPPLAGKLQCLLRFDGFHFLRIFRCEIDNHSATVITTSSASGVWSAWLLAFWARHSAREFSQTFQLLSLPSGIPGATTSRSRALFWNWMFGHRKIKSKILLNEFSFFCSFVKRKLRQRYYTYRIDEDQKAK